MNYKLGKKKKKKKKLRVLLFDDLINRKFFYPNKIKIDKKSYKNILIHFIGYMTVKDTRYIKVNSINPLYIIINKINGYFEEINGNK